MTVNIIMIMPGYITESLKACLDLGEYYCYCHMPSWFSSLF